MGRTAKGRSVYADFLFDDGAARRLFGALEGAALARVRRTFHEWADDVETWMRENAPWQDRTGAARRGLHVERIYVRTPQGGYFQASLRGAVSYQRDLELLHAGRYAILGPTVDAWGPQLMERVRDTVRAIESEARG